MKYSFTIGLVLGFFGLLAAAAGYPWVQHPRPDSQTEVVPNGGRAERFVIRLPADRLGGFAADVAEGAAPVPRPGRAGPLSIEQFKVRNAAGRVIGLAVRHASATDAGRDVAWLVTIPGRGTLMLGASLDAPGALERALTGAGFAEGAAWEGELSVDTVTRAADASQQLSAGSDEFAGLEFAFAESWTVTGVGADGMLRGTIELDTLGRRGS